MKKMKFTIAGAFIIVFVMEIFSFAAEVKNTPPAAPAAPAASAASGAAPKQIQQTPVPSAVTTPAVAPAQVQQKQVLSPTATDNYSYNPTGKPDPFRPLVEAKSQSIASKEGKKKKRETKK